MLSKTQKTKALTLCFLDLNLWNIAWKTPAKKMRKLSYQQSYRINFVGGFFIQSSVVMGKGAIGRISQLSGKSSRCLEGKCQNFGIRGGGYNSLPISRIRHYCHTPLGYIFGHIWAANRTLQERSYFSIGATMCRKLRKRPYTHPFGRPYR